MHIKTGTKYHLNTLLNNYNQTEKEIPPSEVTFFTSFFFFYVFETTTASLCELQYMHVYYFQRKKKAQNSLDCAVPKRAQKVSEATPRLMVF